MKPRRAFRCSHCGESYAYLGSAQQCCTTCCAILPHPTDPTMGVSCHEKVAWWAPKRSNLFPLVYCAQHAPSDA